MPKKIFLSFGLMLLLAVVVAFAIDGDLQEDDDPPEKDGKKDDPPKKEENSQRAESQGATKTNNQDPQYRLNQSSLLDCTISVDKDKVVHICGAQRCVDQAARACKNIKGGSLVGFPTLTTKSSEDHCRALTGDTIGALSDKDDVAIANCCEISVIVDSNPDNAQYCFFASNGEAIPSSSLLAFQVPSTKKLMDQPADAVLRIVCQPIKVGDAQYANQDTSELLKAFPLSPASKNFHSKVKENHPEVKCTVIYLDNRVPSAVVDQFPVSIPDSSPDIHSVVMQPNSKGARYVFHVYHYPNMTDIEVCNVVKTCVKPHVTHGYLSSATKCVPYKNKGLSQAKGETTQAPQNHVMCSSLEDLEFLTIKGKAVLAVRIDLSPLPEEQRKRCWDVLAPQPYTYCTTRDMNNVYLPVTDGQNPFEYVSSILNDLANSKQSGGSLSERLYIGYKNGNLTVTGSKSVRDIAQKYLGESVKSVESSSLVIAGLTVDEVFKRLSNASGIRPINMSACNGANAEEFLKRHGSTMCLPCNAYHLGASCPKGSASEIAKVTFTSSFNPFKEFHVGRGRVVVNQVPDPKTGGSTARSFGLDAAVLREYFAGQETPGDQVDMRWMIDGARAIINIGQHQRRNPRYLFVEDALILTREQLGNLVQANPQMDTIVTFQTIGYNGELERAGHHVLVELRIHRETLRVDHVTIYDDTHIANRQTFQDIARNIRNNLDVPVADDAITFERFDGLTRVLNVGDTCGLHVLEMFFRLLYDIPLRGGTYFFNDVGMYNLNAIAERTVEYFQQPTRNAGVKTAPFSESGGKDGFSIVAPPGKSLAKVPSDSAASATFASPPTPVAKDPDGSATDGLPPVGPIVFNVDNAIASTVGGSDTGAGKNSDDSAANGAVVSTVDGGIVSIVDGPGVSTPHGNTGKMNTVSTTAGSASNDNNNNILADTARDSTTKRPPQARLVADLTTPQGLEDCIGEYCDRRTLTTAPRDGFICDNTQCKKQRKHKSDELPVFSSDGSIPWARCCCGHESYCSIKCARKNPHSVCNLFTTPSPCSSCAKEFKHSELHRCICGSGPFCKACLIEFKKNHECGVAQHTPDPDHAHQNEVIEHMQRNCPQAKTMYCSPTSARNLIIQRLGQKKGSSFFTVLHITPAGLVAASASTGTRPVLVEILFSSKKPLSIDIHIPCLHPGTNHPEAEIKTDRLLQNVRDWLQTLGTPENALPTPETTEYFKTPAMFSSRPGLRLGVVQSLLRDILRLLRGKDLPVKNQNAFKTAVPLDNTFAPFDLTALTALLALLNNASTSTPVSRTKRGRETTESDSESEKSDSSDSEEEDDSSDSDDSDDSE